jgi:magnesium chelatase subunit H
MPKRISDANPTPIKVVFVTMDDHLSGAVDRARILLRKDYPGLTLVLHAAAEWDEEGALARCRADIETADILIVTMLFMEDHIRPVFDALMARRDHCDAVAACLSSSEVVKLTRLGRFSMSGNQSGAIAFLKRLRGKSDKPGAQGAHQMKMLRRLPQILRFIPGTAQDMRAYFLTLSYWLAGSDGNVVNMVRQLIDRYADGPRKVLRGTVKVEAPVDYPDCGLYHPRAKGRIVEDLKALPRNPNARGTVGLLLMRSYLLAGNHAHYDAVIAALESRGLNVVPVFAAGLDARPAIEQYFFAQGRVTIDAFISLTGFSLVGGPAYNDAKSAEAMLARLNVPYLAAHALEFQTLESWRASPRGLHPVETTMMISIPELDGATGPLVFGGRSENGTRDMVPDQGRIAMLASRVDRLIALRTATKRDRKIAIVLFNFPPNAGNTGTAAFLGVFESVFNLLKSLKADGYAVDVPASVDALRDAILHGNANDYGALANVHARIPVDDHVRRERHLDQIEAQWGPAPGRVQTDGATIHVLGKSFGNVLVGVQPGFGYEGDPMRLLFEQGFAPTHAFSAFYRYLREDFAASAVLHFGTHGALEFMPGKQAGMTDACWPDRLIGDLPNLYLYAANNPSEGALARRRSAATLISYLTPPIAAAGLYRGLLDLRATLERWRSLAPDETSERQATAVLMQAQAATLDLAQAEPAWTDWDHEAARLTRAVYELETTLIPHGLHVVGETPSREERLDLLAAMSESSLAFTPERDQIAAMIDGTTPAKLARDPAVQESWQKLAAIDALLQQDHETSALLRALDGKFITPAPGGDLLRTPEILPTGRNVHGFDPFRIPSTFAMKDGAEQADRLLARHILDGNGLPETVALVLWGSDNLKTQGGPLAQALALIGAIPRYDSYGRLCGAALKPLFELGRPRIDVVMTVSGIFRDLLPLQMRLLAEACQLAAHADEPIEENFVRKHALAYAAEHNVDLDTAALRVFSNADGAYGANVNLVIDNGGWSDEDELAETYCSRKCFAYGASGKPVKQPALLQNMLSSVELAYQNLESVELGVMTIDQYFDTLGGISKAAQRASGHAIPVYIGDQTRGEGTVRSLSEQVALEARTRVLNPKWYEGMLKHGYEGVRQIEAHVTNAMGWSATTGQVAPWVYQQITQTFVLDPELRKRLADLNPAAAAKVANRLIEAHERNYWSPDEDVLAALRQAGEELEDRLEGVSMDVAA